MGDETVDTQAMRASASAMDERTQLNPASVAALMLAAADEIDALRGRVYAAETTHDQALVESFDKARERIDAQREANATLVATVFRQKCEREEAQNAAAAMKTRYEEAIAVREDRITSSDRERDAARAEVARLRAALADIAHQVGSGESAARLARAALGEGT